MVKKDSSWWHLRVDVLNDNVEKQFRDAIKLIASQYLIVVERSPKHHLHANILTRESESNIRKKCFCETLKAERMSKYCHKIEDENELQDADQYVCKGESADKMPEVLEKSKVKYTQEKIKEFHDLYWQGRKKSKFLKESKNRSLIEEIAYELGKDRKYNCREVTDRRVVLHKIMDKLGSKGKGFDSIILRRMINGVLNILDPINMRAYMESLIFDPSELSG